MTVGGIVAEYKERPLRSGDGRLAFLTLEDLTGKVEVMVSSKMLDDVREMLQSGEPLIVTAWIRYEGDEEDRIPRLRLKEVALLAEQRLSKTSEVHLTLAVDQVDRGRMEQLRAVLESQHGDARVYVHLVIPNHTETVVVLPDQLTVSPTDELLLRTERLFGDKVAVLR